jgi:hypothetical protein
MTVERNIDPKCRLPSRNSLLYRLNISERSAHACYISELSVEYQRNIG